jgi:AcrR family transcriptional regulator
MSKTSEPIWARSEPGARRPRHTREQIAQAALAIADAEGIDAVSMRRVAAELGAGTMTLYHYVRTKAELRELMSDSMMGELILPEHELSAGWREALAALARRSQAAFARHPWALEGLRDTRGGPNGMLHFEQTLRAVASLDLPLAERLGIALAVDDYVFGYMRHAGGPNELEDQDGREAVLAYFGALLATGDYPELARTFAGYDGADGLDMMIAIFRNEDRFERGLQWLLDGIEASLTG